MQGQGGMPGCCIWPRQPGPFSHVPCPRRHYRPSKSHPVAVRVCLLHQLCTSCPSPGVAYAIRASEYELSLNQTRCTDFAAHSAQQLQHIVFLPIPFIKHAGGIESRPLPHKRMHTPAVCKGHACCNTCAFELGHAFIVRVGC